MAGTKRNRAGRGKPAGADLHAERGGTGKRYQATRLSADAAKERHEAMARLRALAHPLRLRLFELLSRTPRTTMQVAALLGEPPTRLYHHMNALERAGLVRLHETRPVRGTIEKYYQSVRGAAATTAHQAIGLSEEGRQSARAAAAAVLEEARQDFFAATRDADSASAGNLLLLRMVLSASAPRAKALRQRLFDLVKEIKQECAAEAGNRKKSRRGSEERWALTMAFAPSWPKTDPDAGGEGGA